MDKRLPGQWANSRRRFVLGGIAGAGAAVAPVSFAQLAYPVRPIRLVVAFGSGGIADTIARTLSIRLSERMGQPVIVDNRPGAAGALGARLVNAAQPDGYTLLVTTAAVTVNASVSKEAVNPDTGLMPIVNVASTPTIFGVHGQAPSKSLMEFVRSAKSGRLTFGTAGVGTTEHLTAEFVFRGLAGIEATHVPFSSGLAAVSATIGQQVDIAVSSVPTAFGQLKAGTLRAVAVAARARMPSMPEVPTLKEAGFLDFDNSSWIGIFGPPTLAPALVRRLNTDVNAVLRLGEVKERLATIGFDAQGGDANEFAAYVRTEIAKWARVLQTTGIKPA